MSLMGAFEKVRGSGYFTSGKTSSYSNDAGNSKADPSVTSKYTNVQGAGPKAVSSNTKGAHGIERANTGHNNAAAADAKKAMTDMKAEAASVQRTVATQMKSVEGGEKLFTPQATGIETIAANAVSAALGGAGMVYEALNAAHARTKDAGQKVKSKIIGELETKIREVASSPTAQGMEKQNAEKIVELLDAPGANPEKIFDDIFKNIEMDQEYQRLAAVEYHAQQNAAISQKVIDETAPKAQLSEVYQEEAYDRAVVDAGHVGLIGDMVVGCIKIPVEEPETLKCECNKDTVQAIASVNPDVTNTALKIPPPEAATANTMGNGIV